MKSTNITYSRACTKHGEETKARRKTCIYRWEDDIKTDFTEIGLGGMDWPHNSD
jgi:hypothetical protein